MNFRNAFLLSILVVAIAGGVLLEMGRVPWCACGEIWLWSGDVNSSNNSQHISDPYTFTHITHGIGFYALGSLLVPQWSIPARFLSSVALESGWEVLENTSLVIERYRAATISLDYYGDSVVNSIGDIVAAMIGFFIAYRLPRWASVLCILALELLLLWWIRDSLIVNIIMLIYPLSWLKNWQGS